MKTDRNREGIWSFKSMMMMMMMTYRVLALVQIKVLVGGDSGRDVRLKVGIGMIQSWYVEKRGKIPFAE